MDATVRAQICERRQPRNVGYVLPARWSPGIPLKDGLLVVVAGLDLLGLGVEALFIVMLIQGSTVIVCLRIIPLHSRDWLGQCQCQQGL